MTDDNIKQLIERLRQRINSEYMLMSNPPKPVPDADCHMAADLLQEALAFKQEVSDVVEDAFGLQGGHTLHRFIIPKPKPDPLAGVFVDAFTGSDIGKSGGYWAIEKNFRAALEARGLEIRSKNDD